jgi:hypothetical protein
MTIRNRLVAASSMETAHCHSSIGASRWAYPRDVSSARSMGGELR